MGGGAAIEPKAGKQDDIPHGMECDTANNAATDDTNAAAPASIANTASTASTASTATRECARTPGALFASGLAFAGLPRIYEVELPVDGRPHSKARYSPTLREWCVIWRVDDAPMRMPEDVKEVLSEAPAELQKFYVSARSEPYEVHTALGGTSFVTGTLPAAVDGAVLTAFMAAREGNPRPGSTGRAEVAQALALVVRMLANAVAGDARPVPVGGKRFAQRVGWEATSRALFEALGWRVGELEDGRAALHAPGMEEIEAGERVRERMARACAELAAHCVELGGALDGEAETAVRVRLCDVLAELELRPWEERSVEGAVGAALGALGVHGGASEAEVCLGYRVNAALFPERIQELFLALETVHAAKVYANEEIALLAAVEKSHHGLYAQAEVREAERELGIARGAGREEVLGAYEERLGREMRAGTDETLKTVQTALRTVAQSRGDAALAERAEGAVISASGAYELLQLGQDIDDGLVEVAFGVYAAETPERREILRAAVRAIADARGSTYLARMLADEDGRDAGHAADGPRRSGINNIGNTCYLNSVLQYFYSIRAIRGLVLGLVEGELAVPADAPTIGGREVGVEELERACRFARLLGELFSEMREGAEAVTPSKELAYLALVPREWERGGQEEGALMGLVTTQQDVSECLDNMVFQLEAAQACMPGGRVDANGLFVGKTRQRVRGPDGETEKTEEIKSVPVTLLPGDADVYDALDTYFGAETVATETGTVERRVALAEAPALLQVHVQRVQYDRDAGQAVKEKGALRLEDEMYMDRYMDGDDEKRQRTAALRAEIVRVRGALAALRADDVARACEELGDAVEALRETLGDQVEDVAGAAGALRAEGAAVRAEIAALEIELARLRTEVDGLWIGERGVAYRLARVFMHRGEATHGHYFLYERAGVGSEWRVLNDREVRRVGRGEVERDPTGATSYLVVYVREDVEEEVLGE
ncbi:ubiquitinyl hydrolase 1 [Malassezia cuniculi]|uniref:ubiquitinyl hydrolase 1 n=1 Tax=Malassezia cuniculi TaxID=948313 RepID=A0AAF0ESX5_9BASI|nr:ubiquitinyl hydrolase 1 [Malassezia cuniculi]